ncbi:MAG: McrC family protein [Bacteroidales bacterium]|jgi:5-methylcytosine-specific restriction enzyme subunit McrC|nr:McrC family protein [Bacteroidales bacterium]
MTTYQIKEHEKLPNEISPCERKEKYNNKNIFKWDKLQQGDVWGYYAYYRIGAEYIDKEKETALVVTPKIKKIDWAKMFMYCFSSAEEQNSFSEIYDIDFDQKPIETNAFKGVLTPLLLFHFVSTVKKITSKGLKKGYVNREENLHKVKGRIDFLQNFRKNVLLKREERVFCRYNEYSEDIRENRLIKKALLFCERMFNVISKGTNNKFSDVQTTLNQCISAFDNVSDDIEYWEVKYTKSHKLYKEYDVAIKLAKMILRRYSFNIHNVENSKQEQTVPVFWIDMSLLYEHYVLGLLRETYGNQIIYQKGFRVGIPDFLFKGEKEKLILDTKYKPRYDGDRKISKDNIWQLAGYARSRKLMEALGIKEEKEQNKTILPCVIIYPKDPEKDKTIISHKDFKNIDSLIDENIVQKETDIVEFYKLCVELPTLSK